MAIKCDFARWGKIRNSTEKCPESEYIATTDIVFKNAQNIINPVLLCTVNDIHVKDWYDLASEFRYCRLTFPENEKVAHIRYYFIENIAYSGISIIFTLTTDVLATYRDRLYLLQNCWIARSGNVKMANNTLIDSYITQTGHRKIVQKTFKVAENNYTKGYYVIGLINNDTNQIGAITYYAFTNNGFKNFCAQIFGSGSYAGLDGSSTDLATFRAVFNPIQYVTSCLYIPWEITENQKDSEELNSLTFGWYTIKNINNCWRLNVSATGIMGRFGIEEIYKHPQYEEVVNETINVDPYMQITFHAPPWGDITLDTTVLMDKEYIKFPMTLDPVTGNCTIEFFGSNDNDKSIKTQDVFICRYTSQMGISLNLAQVSKDNYAIKTAIATKNANVINAAYSANLTDYFTGALVATESNVSGANLGDVWNDVWSGNFSQAWSDTKQSFSKIGEKWNNLKNFATTPLTESLPRTSAALKQAQASGTESIVKAQQPQVTVISSGVNSVSEYNYSGYLQFSYYNIIAPDYTKIGYPVGLPVEVLGLSGCWGFYALLSNVTFKPGELDEAFPAERDYIVNCLQTGCYLL